MKFIKTFVGLTLGIYAFVVLLASAILYANRWAEFWVNTSQGEPWGFIVALSPIILLFAGIFSWVANHDA